MLCPSSFIILTMHTEPQCKPWSYIGGLIFGRMFGLVTRGLILGGILGLVYKWPKFGGLAFGGLIFGILRYV